MRVVTKSILTRAFAIGDEFIKDGGGYHFHIRTTSGDIFEGAPEDVPGGTDFIEFDDHDQESTLIPLDKITMIKVVPA